MMDIEVNMEEDMVFIIEEDIVEDMVVNMGIWRSI